MTLTERPANSDRHVAKLFRDLASDIRRRGTPIPVWTIGADDPDFTRNVIHLDGSAELRPDGAVRFVFPADVKPRRWWRTQWSIGKKDYGVAMAGTPDGLTRRAV